MNAERTAGHTLAVTWMSCQRSGRLPPALMMQWKFCSMENCSKRDKIGLNSVSFRAAGGAERAAVVVCLEQIAERGGTKERTRGECFLLMVGNTEKRGGAGGGSEQRERWKSFRLLHQNIPTLMQQPAKLQVTPQISVSK